MANLEEVTQILAEARRGDAGALERLTPLVYEELRAAARRQLRRMRPGETLDTTALVHEAYLKMVDAPRADWRDRTHFISVAAVAMRHLLVDYARRRAARKRGGDEVRVPLEDHLLGTEGRPLELLAIHEALEELARRSKRLSRLVELRFFGGLTVEETSEAMGLSERTLKRDWRKARAFLYRALNPPPAAAVS